jgi:hypothetical protein
VELQVFEGLIEGSGIQLQNLMFCGLFAAAVSSVDCIVINDKVIKR